MKLFSESLMSELEQQLQLIHLQNQNPIDYAEQAIKCNILVLEQLKNYFIKYKRLNKKEEIEFFRNIKPKFVAKLVYYNEIYALETNKPLGPLKTIDKYYKAELHKLKIYFKQNKDFYRYYRMAHNYLDNKYFIRAQYDLKLMHDSLYFQIDHRFSTSHDYKVARILANDALKTFLEEQIANLDQKKPKLSPPTTWAKATKWTGSKVDLVELIYALHTQDVFNNGNLSLKDVIVFFETVFHTDLGQFNRVFLEIRNRKSDRTKFLNTLKHKLIVRMEEADEN